MKKARIGIRGKTIFLILLMGISLGAVLIGMTASILSTIVRNDYENKVLDICKNASFAIDGDELGRLQEKYREVLFAIPDSEWVLSDAWGSPEFESFLSKFESLEETPEYKDLYERMTVLLEANDVDDIYLCGIDNTCQPVAFYLVDPAPGEDQCRIGTLDPLYYENSESLLADPTAGFLPYTTDTPEYGWLVTGGVAVFDSSGNVAGYILADISMESIMREIASFIQKLVLAVVLITAVTITLYMFAIEHMVIQPVKKLAQSASVYLSKDTEETEKHSFRELSIKSKDEIGDLYEAICRMEENLNAHIASVMEMTAEKERLGAELDVAARIQEALVPAGFKAFSEENRVDVFGAMVPAKEVGGDFYDFFRIDHDHLGLVMADVSGKGVAAALFMAVTKTFLQSRTMMGGKPEEIMADANR
jgi:sigma-B regulation protein RsbU (phosphoserine phosphatase)